MEKSLWTVQDAISLLSGVLQPGTQENCPRVNFDRYIEELRVEVKQTNVMPLADFTVYTTLSWLVTLPLDSRISSHPLVELASISKHDGAAREQR